MELQQVVGPELARSDLAQIFQALLKDPEAEVRAAAAGKVTFLLFYQHVLVNEVYSKCSNMLLLFKNQF